MYGVRAPCPTVRAAVDPRRCEKYRYIYIYYNYIGGDCGEGNEMTTPSVLQCMLTVDEEDSA